MLIDFLLYGLYNRSLNLLYIRNRSTFVLLVLQGKLSTKSTGGKGQCEFTFLPSSFLSSISLWLCYVVQFVVVQHFNVILSTCNKKHNKISITARAEVTTATETTTTIVASTWTFVKQTLHLFLRVVSRKCLSGEVEGVWIRWLSITRPAKFNACLKAWPS